MKRMEWGRQLRLAAVHFSIPPAEFWQLSVWEWMQLSSQPIPKFMNHEDLQNLIEQFPDQQSKDRKNEST